jgi:hypothetical protein
MKLPLKTKIRSRKSEVRSQTSDLRPLSSERGMALVITLILLSVTLVMAIAFLAISNRERGSITTSTDTATARLAGQSALAAAEGQIIAKLLATSNSYNYGLLVSTNYINGFVSNVSSPTNVNYVYPDGTPLSVPDFEQNLANLFFSPRPPVFVPSPQGSYANATNFDFRFYLDQNRNGIFDTNGFVADMDINGNLAQNPVFEVGDPEWIGVLERPDAPYGPDNKFVSRYAFICLPAGNALDLNYVHNQVFNSPASSVLDLNDGFFRNEGVGSWEINLAALLADLNTNQWGQIVGSGSSAPIGSATYYQYNEPANQNIGVAFDDARSLLAYRYNNNYNSLASLQTTLGALGYSAYSFGNIDLYTTGNLMTNTRLPFVNYQAFTTPWAGSDNTNRFFDLSADLFDAGKTSFGVNPGNIILGRYFSGRLLNAGTNTFGGNTVATYDRYTFYRLLNQLGADSTPETDKMNLNYDNLDLGLNGVLNTNGTASATNFVPWTPIGFYSNAADRMLRLYTDNWFRSNPSNYLATYYGITGYNYYHGDGFGNIITNDPSGWGLTNAFLGVTNQVPSFGIANIPVMVNGKFVYSPAVQRVLQFAANLYDATYYTDHFAPASGSIPAAYLPSVFQPIFNVPNLTNVYITSFVEVTNTTILANQPLNLNYGSLVVATLQANPDRLVFGVPLIIGAKKGFPNFNQFSMQSAFGVGRKLQVTRTSTNEATAPVSSYKINQMFFLTLTNQLGVECWNSYSNNYSRSVFISANDYLSLTLTNDEGFSDNFGGTYALGGGTNLNVWPGFNVQSQYPNPSFQIPLNVNIASIPGQVYHFNPAYLVSPTNANPTFESNVVINGSSYPQPQWGLRLTNNLQVTMIDTTVIPNRIIDYVQLSGPDTNLDLNTSMNDITNRAATGYNGMWVTNMSNTGMPHGIANQINVSLGSIPLQSSYWSSTGGNPQSEIDGFRAFYHLSPLYNVPGAAAAAIIGWASSTNDYQVPYTPSTNFYQYITWQANDPLVHYLASDLTDTKPYAGPISPLINPIPNERYQPWGARMLQLNNSDTNTYNLQFKDPLVWSSDYWDFPTNQFPTVGWLGRVHRGTPWQTAYLKAGNILRANNGLNTWANWTGDFNASGYDAANSGPLQDRLLFDLFTTAVNDNATRGQLPVNLGADRSDPAAGLAAWSALFSGITVLSNNVSDANLHSFLPPSFTAFPIDPAGASGMGSALGKLVQGIHNTRANFSNVDGLKGVFEHVGDILAEKNLTENSPFLNLSSAQKQFGISDEMYEWLPQQMMSLLKVSTVPRYVIYSYGQTLTPAPNSILTGGGPAFSGMITNYQVVAETVTRTVLHIEGAPTNAHVIIESFNILPPQ